MAFEVVKEVESDYLRLNAGGEYSLEQVFEFIELIKLETVSANRRKVLVDLLKINGSMTDADRFFAGRRIAESFGSRIKAAFVMPADQITKLGESVAVSRGALVLVTSSEDEALVWLLTS